MEIKALDSPQAASERGRPKSAGSPVALWSLGSVGNKGTLSLYN